MAAKASKANPPVQVSNGNEESLNVASPTNRDAAHVAEASGEDAAQPAADSSEPERVQESPVVAQPTPTVGIKLGGIKLGTPAAPAAPVQSAPSGGTVPAPQRPAESGNRVVSPASAGVKLGGLSFGGAAAKSGPAADGDSTGGTSAPAPSIGGNLGLLDIASLGEDSSAGPLDFDRTIQDADGDYLDQVPATAPDREIPEGADEITSAFCKSLDTIYNLHNDREMFVSVVSRIMSDMQENKNLVKLLAPEDVNAIMKGMRQAAGMAQVKKQKATAKRKGGKESASSVKLASAMDSLLSVAGFDLSSLN